MNQNSVGLKKSLTWVQGTALTIGAVLGSGVLVLPALAANIAGPASIISWLLMGLLAVSIVIVLANLAGRWPNSGGIAFYAERAFGPTAGTVTGWLFLGTVPIGAPVGALIGANYVALFLSLTQAETTLLAATMLAVALFFNYRGISLSGKVQLAVVSTIAVILLIAIISSFSQVKTQFFIPFAPNGWIPVGVAMTVLFWAFVGWEMIAHLAEEFKNPARDIGLSLGISLLVVNLLYLLLALVIIGTGAYRGPGQSAALAALTSHSLGPWAGAIIAVLGFLVCYGTIHTYIAGFSRLIYAQAKQGNFPFYFAALHPRYQTPHKVLQILFFIFGLVLIIGYRFNHDLTALIQFTSAIFIAVYIIGMASAVKLLREVPLARISAVISFCLCIVIYCFTGWASLYPLVLSLIGWRIARTRPIKKKS
ncbi:amino acid/polyamine transporter i [Lucifera butyrica]|uniref:Amino acid/polyamine transporter i n=1 Tax=Lucifera butyrica TaxID=1351585 RepID=A0A498R6T1_9FIRM|nr:L-methionine/branched-chain amino acid transporter [Lucifera butyrica]VBB08436.1 amino acid/polyamine transporter i [Lucifera butyrica]